MSGVKGWYDWCMWWDIGPEFIMLEFAYVMFPLAVSQLMNKPEKEGCHPWLPLLRGCGSHAAFGVALFYHEGGTRGT